ncbi:alcohol dehydrogenase [Ceratobasidium sp. AG-Ba]|nr:alcohol dehydrogenase [Ceratobasidium sp. AG-Ba]QRW09161.1 alcohol dehydrogenase [Ceratobasidium sp. AG-Ba]
MRGYLLEEYNKPYVYHTDLPVPTARPGEILMKIKAASFCHTELAVMSGDYKNVKLPVVPGHENVGIVAALGDGVADFEIGDRIATTVFRRGCGHCVECQNGVSNFCESREEAGFTHHGGMAEYMRCDPIWTVKIPDSMSFELAAPLMCAGSTIFQSIYRANQPKGAIIAISGIGGLGFLGVQYAKALGYKVVAVDTRQSALDHVRTLPSPLAADLVINPLDGIESALQKISSAFDSAPGVGAAIVATDALPAYAFATRIMARHGTLVVVGLPKDPIPFDHRDIIFRDMHITSGTPCQKARLQEMMDLTVSAKIQVDVKVYEGLESLPELVKDYHDPNVKGKLVVKID